MITTTSSRPATVLPNPLPPDRWGVRITWVAILAPLPYATSRLLWAAGVPLGIDDTQLDVFRAGWGWLGILALVSLTEGTAVFTHTFLKSRPRTIPATIPLLGGKPVRRWLVIAPLLAPIAILAFANAWSLGPITDGFSIPAGNAGLPDWSFWTQIACFWIWGLSLTAATYLSWTKTRGWYTGPRRVTPEAG